MREAGGPSFAELMGDGRGAVRPLPELLRWVAGRSSHTLPAIGLALVETLGAPTEKKARELLSMATRLRGEIEEALGGHGVLLFPPYPRTAPHHNAPLRMPIQWMYTAIFNALELPVTQVPLGLDSRGLPLGVQIVGAPGTDRVTIAVAQALERELGGWVPPGLVER
jgi:fatty acid amide hydrolase 2